MARGKVDPMFVQACIEEVRAGETLTIEADEATLDALTDALTDEEMERVSVIVTLPASRGSRGPGSRS